MSKIVAMLWVKSQDEVPEFEKSKFADEDLEPISLNYPCIVVSYSDDEMTNHEVYQLWNQYASKAKLKPEEHIKVLGEQKKGYYPQIYAIEVSASLLRAVGTNPIDFISEEEF